MTTRLLRVLVTLVAALVPGVASAQLTGQSIGAQFLFPNMATVVQTLGDYSRAVDYLGQRKDVDPDRIGYAGISLGAITGLTFVAHDPRIRAMASIVGGANFLGAISNYPWDPSVRQSAERVDPFYHVAQISPRPLLLLNAKNDQLVPRFFGEQLHAAAGDSAQKVWVDTDHFFRGTDRVKVMETVIDFMEQGLDPTEDAGK